MKVSTFLATIERFWTRAELFIPTNDFANEVKRLSDNVRTALTEQLNITFHTDDDLPPDAEMGKKAVIAYEELLQYLNRHDPNPGNEY